MPRRLDLARTSTFARDLVADDKEGIDVFHGSPVTQLVGLRQTVRDGADAEMVHTSTDRMRSVPTIRKGTIAVKKMSCLYIIM